MRKFFLYIFASITCNVFSINEVAEIRTATSFVIQVSDTTLIQKHKIANQLFEQENYSEALRISLKLLQKAKEIGDSQMIIDTNYLLGKIWYQSQSYEKSITYFRESLEGYRIIYERSRKLENYQPESPLEYLVLENNFKIGTSYMRLSEQLRIDSLRRSVLKDSTTYFYREVIRNDHLKDDFLLIQSKAYSNLSYYIARDSLYDKAISYANKSLEIKKKLNDIYGTAKAYNNLSNIYFFQEKYEKSKESLEKGLEVIDKITGKKADLIKADLYYNLAYSMYMLKDYKAYEFQEKSFLISDELNEEENKRALEEINANNNYELGRVFGTQQEEIKRQKAQKWFIGGGFAFLSIIIMLGFFLKQNKLKRKNLSLELSQQELIQLQKLEKIKAESQIRILNATIDGKESERKQIAETLHDSVSALLSSANLHLQACKTQFNGSTPDEVNKSQSIINEASQKIRDLSHTLVSSILLKFGLSYAIKDITEKFSNSELTIDYETRYIQRYDQGFEIKLYNIIQEFINNILKHSQASNAKITLIQKKKKLNLVIEDNGQGFDKTKIPEKDGLGINQIDARIQMMQGKFDIESAFGRGTKITIELPIHEKKIETIS